MLETAYADDPELITVVAWGHERRQDGDPTLGIGTTDNTPVSTPTPVVGLHDVTAVRFGHNSVFALHRDGTVSAWGANVGAQFRRTGPLDSSPVPVAVPGLAHVIVLGAEAAVVAPTGPA